MAKRVQYLDQIGPHLEGRSGGAMTGALMNRALARYDELLEENADEPKAYHMHTRERIYPAIAAFDAMLAEGIDRAEAADFLVGYYTWRAESKARMVKGLLKIPGLYRVLPKVFYALTQKAFGPEAGFSARNGFASRDEMRMDMVRCPYMDTCVRYGCPEIVRGFCDADDVCYANMHPRLSWERTKTLGYGHDVCDFRIRVK